MADDTTSTNAMAIDLYVNARAANAGKTIDAVETYEMCIRDSCGSLRELLH